jgi:hypothetical protein
MKKANMNCPENGIVFKGKPYRIGLEQVQDIPTM